MTDEQFHKEVDANEAKYQAASENNFLFFVKGLAIPAAHGPMLFGDEDCMADFQRQAFESIAPALHAVKDGKLPSCRRYWWERTKKGSKDADIACCLLWLIAFVDRPFLIQVCAANSDQASIIEDRARAIVHLNPWLNERIEIVERCIRSRKMPKLVRCDIEATGSAGAAQGPTPDVLVLNELVHVDKWKVMEAHMNNADGVPRGLAIVATNAGIKGSPAWTWRQRAKVSRAWRTHILSIPAPWHAPTDIAEAKARDPLGSEYRRLWRGQWVSGLGDAVDEDSLEKCFVMEGPHIGRVDGWLYLAGLDLGVSHDHAGLALIGVNVKECKIAVAYVRGWKPEIHAASGGKKEVDIASVKKECLDIARLFNVGWFGYDPAAGGSFLAQELRQKGVPMVEAPFNASSLTAMATAFVTAVKDGRLECYDDDEGRVRSDFAKFNIKHTPPSNYKLVATSDSSGHADVGTAIVLALPRAMKMITIAPDMTQEDDVIWADEGDLTPEDVEEMPDELRAIYEGEDAIGDDYRTGRGMDGGLDW